MLPYGERFIESDEAANNYKAELDGIISRPLTPESIDAYADQALEDLIIIVQKTISAFVSQSKCVYETKQDMENAAFDYYGLGNIEVTLDYIADKADEIRNLNTVISGAELINGIIVPPDPIEKRERMGSESEVVELIPRLKTLLFVLSNDFDVDLNNPDEFRLKKGLIGRQMMRRESYYTVEIPKLKRTVLVCDERKNATYIFDLTVADKLGVSSDDLSGLTKIGLHNLLDKTPTLGSSLRYSNHFVSRIIKAIEDPKTIPDDSINIETVENSYLIPKAPKGVVSMTGFAISLGIAAPTLAKAVDELGGILGEQVTYRFGSSVFVPGYSPEKQEIIKEYLDTQGLLVEEAPAEVLSRHGTAKELGIRDVLVSEAIKALGDELDDTKTYRFRNIRAAGYTTDQRTKINNYIISQEGFAPNAPEGYHTERGIAKDLGVAQDTIAKAVEELGEKLCETPKYKFPTRVTIGYSPVQQKQVQAYLETTGKLQEQAPEGIKSASLIAKEQGVSFPAVIRSIKKLGEELGEVEIYKFVSTPADGYSQDQQNKIVAYINENIKVEQATDKVKSAYAIATGLGIDFMVVSGAIRVLGNELGNTKKYKFNQTIATGYDGTQQTMIRQHIINDPHIRKKPV